MKASMSRTTLAMISEPNRYSGGSKAWMWYSPRVVIRMSATNPNDRKKNIQTGRIRRNSSRSQFNLLAMCASYETYKCIRGLVGAAQEEEDIRIVGYCTLGLGGGKVLEPCARFTYTFPRMLQQFSSSLKCETSCWRTCQRRFRNSLVSCDERSVGTGGGGLIAAWFYGSQLAVPFLTRLTYSASAAAAHNPSRPRGKTRRRDPYRLPGFR